VRQHLVNTVATLPTSAADTKSADIGVDLYRKRRDKLSRALGFLAGREKVDVGMTAKPAA
jgi:hypothetical protein